MARNEYEKAPHRKTERPHETRVRLNRRSGEQSALANVHFDDTKRAETRVAFLTDWLKRIPVDAEGHEQQVAEGLKRELRSAERFHDRSFSRWLHAQHKRVSIGRQIDALS